MTGPGDRREQLIHYDRVELADRSPDDEAAAETGLLGCSTDGPVSLRHSLISRLHASPHAHAVTAIPGKRERLPSTLSVDSRCGIAFNL